MLLLKSSSLRRCHKVLNSEVLMSDSEVRCWVVTIF